MYPIHHTPRSPKVVIKPLKRIPNKRQAHLGALLRRHGVPGLRGLEHGRVVRLVDLVGREVRGIDVRRETRLKGRPDAPQAVELDAAEEMVGLDLMRTAAAEAVLRVAD